MVIPLTSTSLPHTLLFIYMYTVYSGPQCCLKIDAQDFSLPLQKEPLCLPYQLFPSLSHCTAYYLKRTKDGNQTQETKGFRNEGLKHS